MAEQVIKEAGERTQMAFCSGILVGVGDNPECLWTSLLATMDGSWPRDDGLKV
jgi:hypothetical protein